MPIHLWSDLVNTTLKVKGFTKTVVLKGNGMRQEYKKRFVQYVCSNELFKKKYYSQTEATFVCSHGIHLTLYWCDNDQISMRISQREIKIDKERLCVACWKVLLNLLFIPILMFEIANIWRKFRYLWKNIRKKGWEISEKMTNNIIAAFVKIDRRRLYR